VLSAWPATGSTTCRITAGPDQAVYAYAREDLDIWAAELDTPLRGGVFGENLTTEGIDVTGALIGERWRLGCEVVMEVCCPRIPCGTFQGWLARAGWIKRFTGAARPGAYLRVIEPGQHLDSCSIGHAAGTLGLGITCVSRALPAGLGRPLA
jgi:MOSC domain-containing protein YiiM